MKTPKEAGRKWLGRAAVFALVIMGLYFGSKLIPEQSHSSPVSQPTVAQPAIPPAATTGPAPPLPQPTPTLPETSVPPSTMASTPVQTPTASPTGTVTGSQQVVLSYAVTAEYQLTAATFLSSSQIQQTVNKLAVPGIRTELASQLEQFGAKFALGLGYSSAAEAATSAGYSAQVLMYRFEKFTGGHATIALYMVTQWKTMDGSQYQAPSITLIQMQSSGNTWLYAGTSEPPAGQQPTPKTGLSFDQTVARFQPYLRGYQYVQTS